MKQVNRVEAAFIALKQQEERLGKLFSGPILTSKPFLQERLASYLQIAVTYRKTRNQDERYFLALLKQERIILERQLYPNRLLRFMRKVFRVAIVKPIKAVVEITKDQQSRKGVQEFLKKAGLDLLNPLAERKLKQHENFSLSGTKYLDEGRFLNYTVSFNKNEIERYEPVSYRVALKDVNNPMDISVELPVHGNVMDLRKAQNLLEGRAVMCATNEHKIWYEVDFNDRDNKGSYKLKQNGNYDLEAALYSGQGTGLKNVIIEQGHIERLQNGEQLQFSKLINGKMENLSAQAAPSKACIDFYDSKNQRIDPKLFTQHKKAIKEVMDKPTVKRTQFKVHRG